MAARIEVEVDEQTLAMWRMDASVSGLDLNTWLLRRVGSVDRVRRTPSEVAALLGRRHAAPEVRSDDDEIPDKEEGLPVAPRVSKVTSAPRSQRVAARPRTRDLAGQKFGRLTAVRIVGRDKSGYCTWLCSCECGGGKVVQSGSLTAGMTKSCGCLYRRKSLASV